ncbi:unnamed protein product [Citrullus colocynthis]|uniref:Uncharacterized protein n=1 Tax=Citrullus colocynthis TaxID=252529 RepID=A0ABP0XYH5_9ROSI
MNIQQGNCTQVSPMVFVHKSCFPDLAFVLPPPYLPTWPLANFLSSSSSTQTRPTRLERHQTEILQIRSEKILGLQRNKNIPLLPAPKSSISFNTQKPSGSVLKSRIY